MRFEVAKNAKRNIAVGLINKIVLMILPFVVRSVINLTLGAEYLGLNSLFSSIIQVLSLTELGFSNALIFHMYKPIAENDQKQINALLYLYRKAYRVIGFVIIFIGALILPFLPKLVNGAYPDSINIYLLFLLYVINTSISYFLFGYKQSLLVAYQREDINLLIILLVQLGMQACQTGILLITHNYYFFIICMPIFSFLNNVFIGIATKKLFPEAKLEGILENNTLKDIKKLVIGSFIQKACAVTRNSLDSICISAFLGLVLTGVYNNYYVIFNGLTVLLGVFGTSLTGGIGNHVAVKSINDNYDELKKLDFLFMLISGICSSCMLCLYQPFMELWMGKNMLLPFGAVILICIYFYIDKMGSMKYLYLTAKGLWWKLKWRAIIETIANVVLNIFLGKTLGVYGIISATIISLFGINFLWGSSILFNEYFGSEKIRNYFGCHLLYMMVTIVVCTITYIITSKIVFFSSEILQFTFKAIVSIAISSMLFGLIYCRTRIFQRSIQMIIQK